MFTVSVARSFVAQHYLTVPDPGQEGIRHSHHYTVEATFFGPGLNEYGYLIDIDDATAALETTVESFRDRTLNDLAAFDGLNPSAERFARIFADRLLESIEPSPATRLRVVVDEDEVASVSYERSLTGHDADTARGDVTEHEPGDDPPATHERRETPIRKQATDEGPNGR